MSIDARMENIDFVDETGSSESIVLKKAREEAESFRKRESEKLKNQTVVKEAVEVIIPGKSNLINNRPPNDQLDSRYIRIQMLSGCIFYDFKEVFIRPLDLQDLSQIYVAVTEENMSILIDVIDRCLSVNARKLTLPDFKYVMYWLRINSYPKSPFTIEWKSKYGNQNVTTINDLNLQIVNCPITEERARYWEERGFTSPNIGDFEYLQIADLTKNERWMYERAAQYCVGNTIEEKINKLMSLDGGLGGALLADEFSSELIDYGITEYVDVIDEKFTVQGWLTELNKRNEDLKRQINLSKDEKEIELFKTQVDSNTNEINNINLRLQAGEVVSAEKQRLFHSVDATELLSIIQRKEYSGTYASSR